MSGLGCLWADRFPNCTKQLPSLRHQHNISNAAAAGGGSSSAPASAAVCLGYGIQNFLSWTFFNKKKSNFSAENPAVPGGFTCVGVKQRPRDLPGHCGAREKGFLGPCESLELVKLGRWSWRTATRPWGPSPKTGPRQLTLHSTKVKHISFLDYYF